MGEHVFTGFGFGPIQSGLFAAEAFASGNFSRIVVAEIDKRLVEAVRANGGSYYVNVARGDGIETVRIEGVELLDPNVEADRILLTEALGESTEIVTSLPSVGFYESGGETSVASLIAEGLRSSKARGTVIYTAENNNHAAEILEKVVRERIGGVLPERMQFLNTVIGKMSRVVDDAEEIAKSGLEAIAPGIERAFLVEQFNRILVSRARISGFSPGIEVFIEKDDLLPFEEAKLYGHNAVHALLGFIGSVKGYASMTELKGDSGVMQVAREAFLEECGAALRKKYGDLGDELFTEEGFKDYVDDLLERITNPYLGDTTARAGRDAVRKLGLNDRIFGTMELALEYGIEPKNMAVGAIAGIAELLGHAERYNVPADLRFDDWRELGSMEVGKILGWVWGEGTDGVCKQVAHPTPAADSVCNQSLGGKLHTLQLVECVMDARERLKTLTG